MPRRAPGRAFSLIGVATVAVGLTLVVSTVATGSVFGGPSPSSARRPTPPGPGHPLHRRVFTAPAVPSWVVTSSLALLALAVIALIVFARGRRRAYAQRLRYDEDDEPVPEDWAAYVVALSEAAEEQLRELRQGAPRNAIVACWMRLQEATAALGVPAEPAETSREFALRALRRLRLDDAAVETLSALYREARFSSHEMTEAHRDRALRALTSLVGALARPRAPGAAHTGAQTLLDSAVPAAGVGPVDRVSR